MKKKREMDGLIDMKMGSRKEVQLADIELESSEEYFLLVNALARIADGDPDCPFEIRYRTGPDEVKAGRFLVPNATVTRKRVYVSHDSGDPHLIGNKNHLYDTEEKVFFA